MEPILGIRGLADVELDGFEAVRMVAEEPSGKEADAGIGSEEIDAMFPSIVGDDGGPTDFEDEALAGFGLEESDTEVFDIEGAFGVDLAFAPIELAEAAIAKFGVGLGGDGGDVEIAHEVEAGVEEMDADVIGASAAGILFLSEPGADAGNAAASNPKAAGVIDFAEVAAFDECAGHLGVAIEAKILRDHEDAFHLARGIDDLKGVPGICGHRLLEEDVLAGFQGVNGDLGVEMIGDCDGDGVDVRLVEQFAIIRIAARDAKTFGGFFCALRIAFGYGDARGARAS